MDCFNCCVVCCSSFLFGVVGGLEWAGGVDSEFIEENISFLCLFALFWGVGGRGCSGVFFFLSIVYQYQRISVV